MQSNNGMSDSEKPNDAAAGAWSKPQGMHIPDPTYMPVVLAVGMVCMLWGILTTYLITLVGVVLFAVGISGWIGELRHEHRHL
ncbi:MAG TPA: hypothetical protein VMW54_13085 [Terriglobia bacterium]|nr:hypothetical protein [Terriglobia bacterium]